MRSERIRPKVRSAKCVRSWTSGEIYYELCKLTWKKGLITLTASGRKDPQSKVLDLDTAQRQLVRKVIDWEAVERRLQRFPAIGRAFSVDLLKSGEETPPYYCHYMAWRLGTWSNESLFARLDGLLDGARELPDWPAERPLLESADFSDFWSLVWQLQVAEYLRGIGTDVRWAASGPDLSVRVESERWFVECYAYRKSFGLMLFLEEVLARLDPSIRVAYNVCTPFSLPTDRERSGFLHSMLSPFLDPRFVDDARSRSTHQYPVVLGRHDSGLIVYMEGPDPEAYVPGIAPHQTGDSEKYLEVALNEAIRAKRNANSLGTHRPNLVAVNYALSVDAQLALNRADDLDLSLPVVELGPNIDALAIATVGIDERLAQCGFRRVASALPESPALDRITFCTT